MKNEKIVKKHLLKNYKIINEIYLKNFTNFNIYITLLYDDVNDLYKISWVDFNLVTKIDFKEKINYQLIDKFLIEDNLNFLNKIQTEKYYKEQTKNKENNLLVSFDYKGKKANYYLTDYIPLKLSYLLKYIEIIFNHLPLMLIDFRNKMLSYFYGNNWYYELDKKYITDIFKEDAKILFDEKYILKADKIKEDDLWYLEKVKDVYYAVFKNRVVTIIKYDEKDKSLIMKCNCDAKENCEHKLFVLNAIKNKVEKRFYKITYKRSSQNLYEKLLSYDYVLCLELVDFSFEVINREGKLEYIGISDRNWEVLEDDEKMTLEKALNKAYKEGKF